MVVDVCLPPARVPPQAALSIGRAIAESWIKPRNLIFWNNGLDSSEEKSSEGYVALMEIIRAAKVGEGAHHACG